MKYCILLFYISYQKKIIYGPPPKNKFLAPLLGDWLLVIEKMILMVSLDENQ